MSERNEKTLHTVKRLSEGSDGTTSCGECAQDRLERLPPEEKRGNRQRYHRDMHVDTAVIQLHPTAESSLEESQKRIQPMLGSSHDR